MPFTSSTKIVFRANDPASEMMLPDAVNHHTSQQRVFLAREPIGQSAADHFLNSVGSGSLPRISRFLRGTSSLPSFSLSPRI